ncbi:hypothetical protein WR25_14844 [Diploscapter pachys]|uniref:Phospholipase A(2) n=1 Tax=Diploscapter pachys TaxID=2018661 RepID=A0A2A2KNG2_9BILA|nr:hypothetical protein WR25_14844 [Diploscapter pachys]
MFLKLFLVAISLISLVSGRFACGRDEMTSKFNENMVEKGCPELIRGFDDCCLRHGRCYDFKEKKREECDATFCQCLNNQAKKNKGCNVG